MRGDGRIQEESQKGDRGKKYVRTVPCDLLFNLSTVILLGAPHFGSLGR